MEYQQHQQDGSLIQGNEVKTSEKRKFQMDGSVRESEPPSKSRKRNSLYEESPSSSADEGFSSQNSPSLSSHFRETSNGGEADESESPDEHPTEATTHSGSKLSLFTITST